MGNLPFDVLVNILSFLPVFRERHDTGPRTIFSCLSVNSLFRDAAKLPSLWKPHYQMRYRYSDLQREQARKTAARNNWQIMYAQRRCIDHAALKLLDKIVTNRVGLQSLLSKLIRQYMDVWDVLELESTCPIPREFIWTSTTNLTEQPSEHSLCRRYWAKAAHDTITRAYGCTLWRKFNGPDSDVPSFELAMSSMSTVFGVSDIEVTGIIDGIASRCRNALVTTGVVIDKTRIDFDLRALCIEICVFLRREGLSLSHGRDEPNIFNKFPHTYLTTDKTTLPIALVHIFIAICTRLGINAYPINFPGIVLCHVPAIQQDRPPLVVNPSCFHPQHAVVDDNIPSQANPVTQIMNFHPWLQTDDNQLAPCGPKVMLIRACRNIAATLRASPNYPWNRYQFHPPILLLICIVNLLLEDEEDGLRLYLSQMDIRAVDCIFLLDELVPYLNPRRKVFMEHTCTSILEIDEQEEKRQHKRTPDIRYFVGMAISIDSGYSENPYSTIPCTGFITDWKRGSAALSTTREDLPSSVNEKMASTDGMFIAHSIDGRERALTPDSICPATFTLEDVQAWYRNVEDLPLWFEGVDLPKDPAKGIAHRDGRGRLLLSPQHAHKYPDDSSAGARWVEHGMF